MLVVLMIVIKVYDIRVGEMVLFKFNVSFLFVFFLI